MIRLKGKQLSISVRSNRVSIMGTATAAEVRPAESGGDESWTLSDVSNLEKLNFEWEIYPTSSRQVDLFLRVYGLKRVAVVPVGDVCVALTHWNQSVGILGELEDSMFDRLLNAAQNYTGRTVDGFYYVHIPFLGWSSFDGNSERPTWQNWSNNGIPLVETGDFGMSFTFGDV